MAEIRIKTDIEIAREAKLRPVIEIAKERFNISAQQLEPYGHYKAKLSLEDLKNVPKRQNSKLILVTAMTPTTAGEGKTTTTVGLGDARRGRAARCTCLMLSIFFTVGME